MNLENQTIKILTVLNIVLVLISAADPGDTTVSGKLAGGVGAGAGLPADILPDDILVGMLPEGILPEDILLDDDVDVAGASGAEDAGGGDGGRGGVRIRSNLWTN